MADRLAPFSEDLPTALALGREALFAHREEGIDPEELWPFLEEELRAGKVLGGVLRRDREAVGFTTWDRPGPIGLTIRLFYLRPATRSGPEYRAFLELVERVAGPVVFLPASLAGLSDEEEGATLRPLGFATYARSEMTYPAGGRAPSTAGTEGIRVRPFRAEDAESLARAHAAAYEGRFDRYLFLEDLDPLVDARSALRDLRRGRWGEFLSFASMVAEREGQIVGGTLVVRTARGALIADVAVAPDHAGRGVGRAAVAGTIAALRERGETWIRLVVTEGNRRAVQLYERLGFVRSIGPTLEWYRTALVPARPDGD